MASDPPSSPLWLISTDHKYQRDDASYHPNHLPRLYIQPPSPEISQRTTNTLVLATRGPEMLVPVISQTMEQVESDNRLTNTITRSRSATDTYDATWSVNHKRRASNGEGGIGGSIRRRLSVASNELVTRTRNLRRPSNSSNNNAMRNIMRLSSNNRQQSPPPSFAIRASSSSSPEREFPDRKARHDRSRSEVLSARPSLHSYNNTHSDLPLSPRTFSPERIDSSESASTSAFSRMSSDASFTAETSSSLGDGLQASSSADVPVPMILQHGVQMIKVSAKKQKRIWFRIDPDEGQIIWQGKKLRISEYLKHFPSESLLIVT